MTYPQDGESVGELLERADEAMYRSKRSGRDRTTGVPVMDEQAATSGQRTAVARTSAGGGRDPV